MSEGVLIVQWRSSEQLTVSSIGDSLLGLVKSRFGGVRGDLLVGLGAEEIENEDVSF